MITFQHIAKHENAISKRLIDRSDDLERYARTIADLQSADLTLDASFQRRFNGLYGVRRNARWREIFYAMLERHKDEPDLDFRFVLMGLHEKTGRVEASFASKLIATINPMRLVYDSGTAEAIVDEGFGEGLRHDPPKPRGNVLNAAPADAVSWGKNLAEGQRHDRTAR